MLKYGMLCGSVSFLLLAGTAHTDLSSPQKGQPAPLLTLRAGSRPLWAVKYSPDGTRLATSCAWADAALWDAATGKRLLTLGGDFAPQLRGLAFHPKGGHLATGAGDGTLAFWDAETGRVKPFLRDDRLPVFDLAFHPSGQSIAVGGYARGTGSGLKVWDSTKARRKVGFLVRGRTVSRIAFSPSGKRLASADTEGQVVVWEVATGEAAVTLRLGHSLLGDLAWSPDGHRLAVVYGGMVKVWELPSGKEVLGLRGPRQEVSAVAFLPDGKRLLACEYDLPLPGPPSPGKVRLWDTATAEGRLVLRTNEKEWGIYSLCISPDGGRLATGSRDGTVKVWSVKDLLGR